MTDKDPPQLENVPLRSLLTSEKPLRILSGLSTFEHAEPSNHLLIRKVFSAGHPATRMFAFGCFDGSRASGYEWLDYELIDSVSSRYLTWILNSPSVFLEIRAAEPSRDQMLKRYNELKKINEQRRTEFAQLNAESGKVTRRQDFKAYFAQLPGVFYDPYVEFLASIINDLSIPMITNWSRDRQDHYAQRFEYKTNIMLGTSQDVELYCPDFQDEYHQHLVKLKRLMNN